MANITNTDDLIDVRDIIARVEELEEERGDLQSATDDCDSAEQEREAIAALDAWNESDEAAELATLSELLSDLAGCGGDEQWRGDWYPVTLVRDSHFTEYAQELADDIGAMDTAATWPHTCIDWEWAARELQMDYSSVEFDGVTYWYR